MACLQDCAGARPERELGDPVTARGDGAAVALRVAGDPADGHVDPEPGGGALLLGLAAPEPVLTVLACPVAALEQDRAVAADRACPALADYPGLGPLPRRREEEIGLSTT